jgi:hypothetical protein
VQKNKGSHESSIERKEFRMKRNRNKNGSLSFKFNADLDTSEGNHSAERCTVGEISRIGGSPFVEGSAIVILRVSGMEDLKILRTTEPKQHGISADNSSARHDYIVL